MAKRRPAARTVSPAQLTNSIHLFHPKPTRQREAVRVYENNDIVFYVGPAGTGKTYVAMALALQDVFRKDKKLILTRPAVEAGERLGFLPGGKDDKLEPYTQPLQDSATKILVGDRDLTQLFNEKKSIVPLAYMRGRTFDNSICILDEAQNASRNQIKMFLTRIGTDSKMIVCGDTDQTDLPGPNALCKIYKKFQTKERVGVVEYQEEDIVRHPLIRMILSCFKELESE